MSLLLNFLNMKEFFTVFIYLYYGCECTSEWVSEIVRHGTGEKWHNSRPIRLKDKNHNTKISKQRKQKMEKSLSSSNNVQNTNNIAYCFEDSLYYTSFKPKSAHINTTQQFNFIVCIVNDFRAWEHISIHCVDVCDDFEEISTVTIRIICITSMSLVTECRAFVANFRISFRRSKM